jgi:hypothetical protein
MWLPCITIPSVEVPHFDGNDFVSWKSQMSTYLREMNPQVWWMVDVGLCHALQDCPQTQAQKKCLYLEAHASNGLSSALSAEIKNEVKMEYGWPERANLLWKVVEQMYDSTRLSSFGKIETSLTEEDDCSTPSSDDDDDTDVEYHEHELLVEFKKLISKHVKLQKRHGNLLCSQKELMDSCALLESAHEVMVTTVKDS